MEPSMIVKAKDEDSYRELCQLPFAMPMSYPNVDIDADEVTEEQLAKLCEVFPK